MAGRRKASCMRSMLANTKIRMPKNPFGSPKKIMKRGFYELMWGAPTRDYGKKVRGK